MTPLRISSPSPLTMPSLCVSKPEELGALAGAAGADERRVDEAALRALLELPQERCRGLVAARRRKVLPPRVIALERDAFIAVARGVPEVSGRRRGEGGRSDEVGHRGSSAR